MKVETNRIFIPWAESFLAQVAEYFIKKSTVSLTISEAQEEYVFVFPGKRVIRNFVKSLTKKLPAHTVTTLPKMCTLGELPEILLPDDDNIISDQESRLALMSVLQGMGLDRIQVIFPLVASCDFNALLPIVDYLIKLKSELASAGAAYKSILGEDCRDLIKIDFERWQVLFQIYANYEEELRSRLQYDKQLRRLEFCEQSSAQVKRVKIALIGIVELPPLYRQLIQLHSRSVDVYVYADREFEDYFDGLGCVLQSKWNELELEFGSEKIFVGTDREDCLKELLGSLSQKTGDNRPENFLIGVSADSVSEDLFIRFREFGVPYQTGIAAGVGENEFFKLLKSILQVAGSNRLVDLVELLRFPCVARFLYKEFDLALSEEEFHSQILEAADRYLESTLQFNFRKKLNRFTNANPILQTGIQLVVDFLDKFAVGNKSISCHCEVFVEFLSALYPADSTLDFVTQEILKSAIVLCESLGKLESQLSSQEFLGLMVVELKAVQIERQCQDHEGVQISGWLELPFIEQSECYLLGFEEGFLPTPIALDPLIPEKLREYLGLATERDRLARDLYIFKNLLSSKNIQRIFYAKNDNNGDPLLPSRLLYACGGKELSARAQLFFNTSTKFSKVFIAADVRDDDLVIAAPRVKESFGSILSVTAFKDYLQCPYRFYLRHVREARSYNAKIKELQHNDFGILLHDILCMFGKSELRDSESEVEIKQFLLTTLEASIAKKFGANTYPALKLQYKQLKERLLNYAAWQSEWRQKGWKIQHTELDVSQYQIPLKHRNGSSVLTARIDRVDLNELDGSCMVIDYKTADRKVSAFSRHIKKGEWIDLQLPLYLEIIKRAKIHKEPRAMLLNLSAEYSEVNASEFKIDEEKQLEAMNVAAEVAASIMEGNFWPPKELPYTQDLFSRHCGIGQRGAVISE